VRLRTIIVPRAETTPAIATSRTFDTSIPP
jgi:hypothetical protein